MGAGGGPSGESAKDTSSAVRRLLGYLRPYRLRLIVVAVLVVITTIGQLAGPILLGIAIDRFILPGDVPGLIRICDLDVGRLRHGGRGHHRPGHRSWSSWRSGWCATSAPSSSPTCRRSPWPTTITIASAIS